MACVVKSDSAIPYALKEELKAAVQPLEDVPNEQKDWHPGSGDKVLDLVHPSLYPLMYGKSRILRGGTAISLENCIKLTGSGVVIPKQTLISAPRQRLRYGEDEDDNSKRPHHHHLRVQLVRSL